MKQLRTVRVSHNLTENMLVHYCPCFPPTGKPIIKRLTDNNEIKTFEWPQVQYNDSNECEQEYYVKTHEGEKFLVEHKDYNVIYYDPRDAILRVNPHSKTAVSENFGTRITPLKTLAKTTPLGGMKRMVMSRNAKIAAAIGHEFLLESTELGQGQATMLAKGF